MYTHVLRGQFVQAVMRAVPVQLNEIDLEILFDKIAAFERRGLKNGCDAITERIHLHMDSSAAMTSHFDRNHKLA